MKADYTQITAPSEITATCPNGGTFTYNNAVVVPLVVEDAASLTSGHTIGAAVDSTTAQAIAQAVMDALYRYQTMR